LTPVISLNIPFIQRKVIVFSESELSKRLKTTVKIGKIDIHWLNRITFKDVLIEDQKGNTLLTADHLTAGFRLLPILQNKWLLTTVRLFGVTCYIQKESAHSETNLQFIFDAFSGEPPTNSNSLFQIESIFIRRGKIRYDVLDTERTHTNFNPNHVRIDNLSGKFTLKHFSADSIHAEINKMSFDESSGLHVNKITAVIKGDVDSLCVENLMITLPRSSLLFSSATIKQAQKDSLSQRSNPSSLSLRIAPSLISPIDFAFLTPVLNGFPETVHVAADISGLIDAISLNQLTLTYGKDFHFSGGMDLKNLTNQAEELYVFGRIKNLRVTTKGLQNVMSKLHPQNAPLPESVMNLEELNFSGEIAGFIDHLVAFGDLSTPIGSIQMDVLVSQQNSQDSSLYLKGLIASSDLQINALFKEGNPFGTARFNVEFDFIQPQDKLFSGSINAHIHAFDYLDYNYQNIYLSGKYKKNEYQGLVYVSDPNGKLQMQGLFKNEDEKAIFDFRANLSHFRPDKLHLTERFVNPDISLELSANYSGNNPDDFNGYIELKDLNFLTEKDSFSIHDLRIETFAGEQAPNQIQISSSVLNGGIKGVYSFSAFVPNVLKTLDNYLPSLVNTIKSKKNTDEKNNFDFNFSIGNTDNISKTLKLPVTILQNATFQGHYNSETHSFFTSVNAPLFKLGNLAFENLDLRLSNADEAIYMQLNATQIGKNNLHNYLHLTSDISDDCIQSAFRWSNDTPEKYEAAITASTLFVEESDGNLRTEITIPPAQIVLKDSIWTIEPASVTISNNRVMIDNFFVTKEKQHLLIHGTISDNPKDALFLDLKDLEISHIFDILNNPQIQFGGQATGLIKACDLLGSMMIEGRLEVDEFSFHNAIQGKLKLTSEWDNDRQGILLIGSIYKNDYTYTDVEGYIFPIGPEQGLALTFNANEINLAFLQKYMNAFSDSVSGMVSGKLRLYGSFSDIYLEDTVYVENTKIKLNVLNTTYTLSDTIYFDKKRISTRNTTIYDDDGHAGIIDFSLNHDCFRDFSYNIDVKADKMLIYDISERINPEIYGKVYASGIAKIYGTEDDIRVEGNIRSDAGTAVGFNFSNNSTVNNYDFISFKDDMEKVARNDNIIAIKPDNDQSRMDYLLNFIVSVTPDAYFELMMNPSTGDKISGSGTGNFQIQYGNRNDIQIFGNYLISEGVYNFNLEQVLRRRFNIRDGSVVSFRGDPMSANLNINAIYSLAANVQDLDELLIKDRSNPTVMVNCVLKLDGHLQNPAISFDLELPSSNAELERQVRSFIDTEDMMMRQIVYLLLLQKFYTPDYSRNDFRTSEFSAVASQALSTQISNILNNLTDKVQFGTLIRSRQDGIKDTEIDMLLTSQLLNNRLIFNGNFGYKDNYIRQNAFVGEFDLEYKLTRSGEISLKAYNHANDFYRYTKSLTRQGVGLMFRKDFSTLTDLFMRKK